LGVRAIQAKIRIEELNMRSIIFMLSALTVCACTTLQRSQQSGYAEGSQPTSPSNLSESENSLEHKRVAYELGYDPNTALTEDQLRAIDDRRQLRILERRIESQREKEQYSKILPWLNSDKERIQFLSIPTVEGRQAWIQQNGVWQRSKAPRPALKEIIDQGDIAVGMPQDYVKKAWGEPQDKEVSGNPLYKNEKWKYTRYVSTGDGFKKETRYVYFEGGKVVGWETE
jgi:hypothetical protein